MLVKYPLLVGALNKIRPNIFFEKWIIDSRVKK